MLFLFNQDVPLISLANIFQNARLWDDALTVARMAVEIAPHFVVNHFTLANVYIAMVMAASTFICHNVVIVCYPLLSSSSVTTARQFKILKRPYYAVVWYLSFGACK